jgi:hypothetical protein
LQENKHHDNDSNSLHIELASENEFSIGIREGVPRCPLQSMISPDFLMAVGITR